MPHVVAVIPARMGSFRFPGKPLAPLLGRSMLEHVYRRACAATLVDEIVIATCDQEILQVAQVFGARVIMTSATHKRATDRVAEAISREQADLILMIQGDEPMIRPEMIDDAIRPLLSKPNLDCVNLAAPIQTVGELRDPNTIKVAFGCNGDALFFSREPIPTLRNQEFIPGGWFKQVCVIAFRRRTLEYFATLSPTPLEVTESIDMLRFLEHGIPIRVVPTLINTHAVDTPSDLKLVESMLASDPSTAAYF